MNTNTFSVREAIEFGYKKMKEHFSFLILLTVVIAAITHVLEFVDHKRGNRNGMSAVSLLFCIIVSMGVIRIALNIVQGKEFGLSDFNISFDRFWKFLVATITLSILIMLGIVALIIPGIYLIVTYCFATYFIIDKNLGPIEAMKQSAQITKGNKWKLVQFMLAIIGLNIAGLLALGVGLFITIPISYIATAWVYMALLQKQEPVVITAAETIPA